MNEQVDHIINKFVTYKIKLDELQEIAPLVSTSEFKFEFEMAEDIHSVIQLEGREELHQELTAIIASEKLLQKKAKAIKLRDFKLQAIAASVLIICAIGIFKATSSDYNRIENFRKTYINK